MTCSIEQYFWFCWAASRSEWFKPVALFIKFYTRISTSTYQEFPLINPDEDKENEKQGGKEKADIMTLEKCKLSRHQESVQKSKDPKELCGPRCMLFCEDSNAPL